MQYLTISLKQFFPAKVAIYHVAMATVIFSHVKITCFRAKAHLVFHWRLYNKLHHVKTENPSFRVAWVHWTTLSRDQNKWQ